MRRAYWRRMKAAVRGIDLVDRCLIGFMFVLLIQSVCSLLLPPAGGAAVQGIDIIVRTSSAAIFGHFIGANFAGRPESTAAATKDTAASGAQVSSQPVQDQPVQKIGFSTSDEPVEQGGTVLQPTDPGEIPASSAVRMQVVVAAGIGLFCLIVLLLFRNIPAWRVCLEREGAVATVAQFRDFISGCVGFLIGCPACVSTPKQP